MSKKVMSELQKLQYEHDTRMYEEYCEEHVKGDKLSRTKPLSFKQMFGYFVYIDLESCVYYCIR